MRSVGENPLAADTAGISPIRVRYYAVIASGAFAALGGVFLSIGFVHSFSQNMTAGKGFIGLAAVIFGKWKPGGALAAALLFGFSQRARAAAAGVLADDRDAVPGAAVRAHADRRRGPRRPLAPAGRRRHPVRAPLVSRVTRGVSESDRPSPRLRVPKRPRPPAARSRAHARPAGLRRGRALPPHLHDAAALERRDAAAGARAVAPLDDARACTRWPARRSSTSARSCTRSGGCPTRSRARA